MEERDMPRVDSPEETVAVPLAEEQLRVGKQAVERRITFRKQTETLPAEVRQMLASEEVRVERVPRDQIVETPSAPRQDDDMWIIPVYEEIVVVEKRLRLKEEIHIRKQRRQHEHVETIPVRRETVQIEDGEQATESKAIPEEQHHG